jgi:hypothetical protein
MPVNLFLALVTSSLSMLGYLLAPPRCPRRGNDYWGRTPENWHPSFGRLEVSDRDWRDQFEVNLNGTANVLPCLRAAAG